MRNFLGIFLLNFLVISVWIADDWRTNAQKIGRFSSRKHANNQLGLRMREGDTFDNVRIKQHRSPVPNQRRGRQRHGGHRQGKEIFLWVFWT